MIPISAIVVLAAIIIGVPVFLIAFYHGIKTIIEIRAKRNTFVNLLPWLAIFFPSNFTEVGQHHRRQFLRFISIFIAILLLAFTVEELYAPKEINQTSPNKSIEADGPKDPR